MLDHVNDLENHIHMVQANARILASHFIKEGRHREAKELLARAQVHDKSKWFGIEWDYLHQGDDIDRELIQLAIRQHQAVNDHHPEFHNGIENMPEMCIAEMVCDWLARAQEFGKDVNDFVTNVATEKYKLYMWAKQRRLINEYLAILTPVKFVNLRK